MRLILTLAFSFLGLSFLFAQQETWTLYQTVDGVSIYYKQSDCRTDGAPEHTAYIIKVVNTTNSPCQVSWDLSVWYNDEKVERNVKDGENHMVIDLPAKGEVQGDCQNPSGSLYVFKDFITYQSPTKLTRFELENITVVKK